MVELHRLTGEAVVSTRHDRPFVVTAASSRRAARPLVALLVVAVATALLVAVNIPSAKAAPEISGKVRAAYGANPPVGGATVRLWSNDSGHPGDLVDSDASDSNGNFTLSPPSAGRYFVQVIHTDFRRGWLADNRYFEPLGGSTRLVSPGADLSPTYAIPTFVTGLIVDQATGNPVAGVRAIALEPATGDELGRATTGPGGRFRITDVVLDDDSLQMRFNGAAVGYESGYFSCVRTVVPTVGDGCGSGLGNIGKIKIQHL